MLYPGKMETLLLGTHTFWKAALFQFKQKWPSSDMHLLLFVSASATRVCGLVWVTGVLEKRKKHNLHTKQSTTFMFILRRNLHLCIASVLVLCSKYKTVANPWVLPWKQMRNEQTRKSEKAAHKH